MKYIHIRNLPPRMPITFTICIWLLWDRYRPAEWVCTLGILWLILIWLGFFIIVRKGEAVDIFKDGK